MKGNQNYSPYNNVSHYSNLSPAPSMSQKKNNMFNQFETNANTSIYTQATNFNSPFQTNNKSARVSILDASPNNMADNYLLTLQDKREEIYNANNPVAHENLKSVREDINEFSENLRSERQEMIQNFFSKVELHNQSYKQTTKKIIKAGENNYKEKRKMYDNQADKIKTNEIENLILEMEKHEKDYMINDLQTLIKTGQKDNITVDELKQILNKKKKNNTNRSRSASRSPTPKSHRKSKHYKNTNNRTREFDGNDQSYYTDQKSYSDMSDVSEREGATSTNKDDTYDSNDEFISRISKHTDNNRNPRKYSKVIATKKTNSGLNNNSRQKVSELISIPKNSGDIQTFNHIKEPNEYSDFEEKQSPERSVSKSYRKPKKQQTANKKRKNYDKEYEKSLIKKSEMDISRNRVIPDDLYKIKYDKAKDKLEELFQKIRKTQKDLAKEKSKNAKNNKIIEHYENELENIDPNYPGDISEAKLRTFQAKLNEKDQLLEEQNLELNTLRNLKILFEKFKQERNKDKSEIMDLEDEIKSLKNVISNGNSDKNQLKLLMITNDDLKSKNNEYRKDKEKLGEDIIQLQNKLKSVKDSENKNYKSKEGNIIRLNEDQKLREERINILEKDRDNYYDQFRKAKEENIKKDKEVLRMKHELEVKDNMMLKDQSEQDAMRIQEFSYIIKNLRGEKTKLLGDNESLKLDFEKKLSDIVKKSKTSDVTNSVFIVSMKEEMRKNKSAISALEDENQSLKFKLDEQISNMADLQDKERKIMSVLKVKNLEQQSIRDGNSVTGSKKQGITSIERDDDKRSRAHTTKSYARPTSILKNNDKQSRKSPEKSPNSVLQSFKNLMQPAESTKKNQFDDNRESSRRKRKTTN